MYVLLFKTVRVRRDEVGLYFRDGEFVGLLNAGRHWFVDPLARSASRSSRYARRGWRTSSST